ncbi:unnamed protein product [marine sediment metagenome]|uniref:Uncharacterized protein n=1 Tax=marine sediment metagenome TaxID=412755 RepID=X1D4M2_9ZZZZ
MMEYYARAHPLVEHIAKNSIEWRDIDKFTCIWDNQTVLVHYNRASQKFTILSDVEEFVEGAIYCWLKDVVIPFPEEWDEEDETD